jgi:hypothetical protein
LIFQKSLNNKALSAAQGGSLCKDKAAFSGRFLKNPQGRALFRRFLQETRLEGGRPATPVFLQKSLKIWLVKPVFKYVNRP